MPEHACIITDTAERGGITLLSGVLDGKASGPVLAEAVLAALGNLMVSNAANTAAIIAASGIERVLEVLQLENGAAGIQQSTVLTLHNLSCAGPAA